MFKITRKEAEKLIGAEVFRNALFALPRGYSGNMHMLSSGAKLNVRNAKMGGRFTSYTVYGYLANNRDIIEAFEARGMVAPCGPNTQETCQRCAEVGEESGLGVRDIQGVNLCESHAQAGWD